MKTFRSQWEFGELFSPEALRRVWTVSELTGNVRKLLEGKFGAIWVSGEISNLRVQSSGHVYFSIKDTAAQLSCVLFRNEARAVPRDLLQDGRKVAVFGDLTVYEARGQYQLRVADVELHGTGALQAAFEKLKLKLSAEGLFAPERKRPIPRYPQRIAVVTSLTGAAIRDVIHVVRRRNPSIELVLAGCRVQGQGAGEEIAAAIRQANEWHVARQKSEAGRGGIDVILVTRGGGSLEDLWAFNEECVARAIFESAIPVVSAVGHEIDFTISDFVADLRAATPSAAAELLTEGFFSSRGRVAELTQALRRCGRRAVDQAASDVERLVRQFERVHPRHWIEDRHVAIDELDERLWRCLRTMVRHTAGRWDAILRRLRSLRPSAVIALRKERVTGLERRLWQTVRSQLQGRQNHWRELSEKLRLLSPVHVLERGYSITFEEVTGAVVRRADAIKPGSRLRTRLQQGEIESVTVGQAGRRP